VALDCGPNFDNDTTATESLPISQADFETFAADGTVTIVIDPTASVGRLKLFSATLEFDSAATAVPEPGSIALVGLGLVGLAATRRVSRQRSGLQ
jgi:hypothetical protein